MSAEEIAGRDMGKPQLGRDDRCLRPFPDPLRAEKEDIRIRGRHTHLMKPS
jgi:hypothetical protein